MNETIDAISKMDDKYKALLAATIIMTIAVYPQIFLAIAILVVIYFIASNLKSNETNKKSSSWTTNNESNFCPNCGTQNNINAKFCQNCGLNIEKQSIITKIDKWLAQESK